MSLRRIKHALLRLSPEEKIIGLGTLFIIIGCFIPWHSIVMSFDGQNITENGFGGDLGVIGFVIFILAIISLLTLIGENLHIKLPQFGYSKEQILFFLMGQNAFLVLLTIAIYTKRSLDFTNAELRFGIYMALIGAFLGAFAAFAQIQKLKKKEVSEFFEHDDSSSYETSHGASHKKKKEEIFEDAVVEEPEELFDQAEEHIEEEIVEEYIPEDEMIEEIEEVDKIEPEIENQANYFTREAKSEMLYSDESAESDDLDTNHDAPPEEDDKGTEKKDKGPNISMNFYEDQ